MLWLNDYISSKRKCVNSGFAELLLQPPGTYPWPPDSVYLYAMMKCAFETCPRHHYPSCSALVMQNFPKFCDGCDVEMPFHGT